jgi:hypothetical protein
MRNVYLNEARDLAAEETTLTARGLVGFEPSPDYSQQGNGGPK